MIENTLFYKDNYLKEFETVVTECFEEAGKIKIILDNTAFYPEGGGQPSDIGFIDNVKVLKVEEKDNKIFHIVENQIEVNKKVKCKINFEERLSNMQHHTAEHIVSGLICRKFEATNVGFHIGKDFTTMDFNVVITEKNLREIEILANKAVYENIDVTSKIYSPDQLKDLNYRSKKELKENVRIVEIKGYDACACCGVHVSKTGEIGIIKLLRVEKYKSGVRIYMLAGLKAIDDYTNKYEQVNNISTLLSLKQEEVYSGVIELTEEIENLKKEKSILKNELLENEILKIENQKNIILEKENLEMQDMKNLCNKLLEKVTGIAGVVSNGKFIMMSNTEDLKELMENLKKDINIKGGGNSKFIQGQLLDNPQKIIEKIKSEKND